ncbi:MAG: ribosome biogenesis GTP-binding protein YihA/YsxC [Gammaproteobacteria bacterium]
MDEAATTMRKLLQGARFITSVPELRQLPSDDGLEVAFAGRSNSGKSSAINLLCQQRALARTSRTPGRTQHLVVFELDAERRLIDLPGFGYARVSKDVRAHWERVLPQYLERRQSLAGLVLLMDIRHPLKPQDVVVIAWCRAAQVPLHILLSKADKLGRGAAAQTLRKVSAYLAENGGDLAGVQLFSALKQDGADAVYGVLARWLAR